MGHANTTRALTVAAALAFGSSLVAGQTASPAASAKPGTSAAQSRAAHKLAASSNKKVKRSSTKRGAKGRKSSKKASWKTRGQQKIDPQRAQDIQTALIREHYLSGKPTGQWDADSQKAMEKFQADQGWQSKVVPDSRALIKLGLGPDQHPLLNPSTAMVAPVPSQAHSLPAPAPAEPSSKASPSQN